MSIEDRYDHEWDQPGADDSRLQTCIHCGAEGHHDLGHGCPVRLSRRVDRLEHILAVETGDESAAPEGWVKGGRVQWIGTAPYPYSVEVIRRATALWWDWVIRRRDEDGLLRNDRTGTAPTALEAMHEVTAALEMT